MSTARPCFAEQDPTVARVAETALRMMSGSIPPATQRHIRELALQAPDAYPWSDVVTAVLGDDVDPSSLVQRGLQAQRDWVVKSGNTPTSRAEARAVPVSPPRLAYSVKRWLAVSAARAVFYTLFSGALVVLLILLQRVWSRFDIYAIAERLEAAVRSVF